MTKNLVQKCLIANRGEIAVRIIRACRELNIQSVAVYSAVDTNALHVQMADEAYLIGEAPPAQSYLRINKLLEIAQTTNCDCVHPGYGFLSESAEFAQAVFDANIVWVGPPPHAILQMGVKTTSRDLMEHANVPIVPGFQSENATHEEFIQAAQTISYPIMVKAAGGGGGKGIRIVYEPDQLIDAIESAQREAQKAFGDARVFLEKYIEAGRHIEIQILADSYGNVVHLFERECSTQRRHQKIIEETPSPLLDAATRQQMGQAAVNAAKAVGYVNAGTVEFIATPNAEFYFLEMNTRLQVEHPVTEMVTGIDLVKQQLLIASGEKLPFQQAEIFQQGHAIECRIYAEDPSNNFLPEIGAVHYFQPPVAPQVRVDTGLQSGDAVTIHYDPMIAKIIVYDHTRELAIERMKQALQNTVILGLKTNLDFLQVLLNHPTFDTGEIDTKFVDDHLSSLLPETVVIPDLALIALAIAEAKPSTNKKQYSSNIIGQDLYSPWEKSDRFRVGE